MADKRDPTGIEAGSPGERTGVPPPDAADEVGAALLSAPGHAFGVLDGDWRFVDLNREAEHLLRRRRQELLGRRLWDAFPGSVGGRVHREFRRAAGQEAPVVFEERCPPLDAWFEFRVYPKASLVIVHFRDVSARRALQDTLQRKAERLQLLAEATQDALWDHDFERDRSWWSDNLSDLFGHSPARLATFGAWRELVHPEDREEVVAGIRSALERRKTRMSTEYRFRRSDGSYAHVAARAVFRYDESGAPRRAVGSLADVTQRKEAESALRAGEHRWRALFDLSPFPSWVVQPDTLRILDVNEAAVVQYGYGRDEFLSLALQDLHPAEDPPGLVPELFATGVEVSGRREERHRTKSGSVLPVEVTARRVAVPGDTVILMAAVDLTERKVAEERQRFLFRAGEVMTATLDYRQRLRALARVCCGPLCDYAILDVVEEDGTIRRLEAAHVDPRKEELVSRLLCFPPAHAAEGTIARALETGELERVEDVDDEGLRRIAQSAEHLAILRALAPRDYVIVPLQAKGRMLGAITLARGRSGRRLGEGDIQLLRDLARQAALDIHNARLHRDVRRAKEAAEQASRRSNQFLDMMSHELRTPLSAIVGFTELIDGELAGPVTVRQKDYLARMRKNAAQLLELIDEVLTESRTRAGRERVRLETTDATRLAREVADFLLAPARNKGLELRCSVPDVPMQVETDPRKLRRILTNLLGNAIKFTDEGRVELELRQREGWLEASVRDTGPGIAPDERERIFEPFVRGGEVPTGGTGLGLAISRRFARMLGGDIEVESAQGHGSVFVLRLPSGPGA